MGSRCTELLKSQVRTRTVKYSDVLWVTTTRRSKRRFTRLKSEQKTTARAGKASEFEKNRDAMFFGRFRRRSRYILPSFEVDSLRGVRIHVGLVVCIEKMLIPLSYLARVALKIRFESLARGPRAESSFRSVSATGRFCDCFTLHRNRCEAPSRFLVCLIASTPVMLELQRALVDARPAPSVALFGLSPSLPEPSLVGSRRSAP